MLKGDGFQLFSRFIKKDDTLNIIDILKFISYAYDGTSYKKIKVGNFLTLAKYEEEFPEKKEVKKWRGKSEHFNLISLTSKSIRKEVKRLDSLDIQSLTITYSETLTNISKIVSEHKLKMEKEMFEKIMHILNSIDNDLDEIYNRKKNNSLEKLDMEIEYVELQKEKNHFK